MVLKLCVLHKSLQLVVYAARDHTLLQKIKAAGLSVGKCLLHTAAWPA
jgi:hypothetical protein